MDSWTIQEGYMRKNLGQWDQKTGAGERITLTM